MEYLKVTKPGLKVVQVNAGIAPNRRPAPPPPRVSPNAPQEIEDTTGPDNNPAQTNTQTKIQAMDNPIKQRAAAQIAVTAGMAAAAYFTRGTNQIAFWLFVIGAVIAGYTVVQPHQRKDGSVRPSAISALTAKEARTVNMNVTPATQPRAAATA